MAGCERAMVISYKFLNLWCTLYRSDCVSDVLSTAHSSGQFLSGVMVVISTGGTTVGEGRRVGTRQYHYVRVGHGTEKTMV